ncbi:steroid 17-alpha-hydroxylase/17,20 lyase-like [Clytia hemisphaerica]|uniref:Steroid 21-hydroxylase n=1 Tax=Clytia hemisphaerica TaxID=252671 RepID=A0A7M5UIN1_9CNID
MDVYSFGLMVACLLVIFYFHTKIILSALCIFMVVITCRTYLLHFYRNLCGSPRGPLPLPILGNIHQLGVMAHENLRLLSKTYGRVMRVLVGDDVVYVISGANEILEGLVTKSVDFAGRPFTYTLNLTTGGKGIAFADYDPKWRFYRKIAHSSMRMFGNGLKTIENLVTEESQALHTRFDKHVGEPIDPHHDLGLAVLNVVFAMIFGSRYDIEDNEFQDLITSNTMFVRGFEYDSYIDVFPSLRFLPNKRISTLKHAIDMRRPILQKHFQKHKDSFDPSGDNKRDLAYALLDALHEAETNDKQAVQEFLQYDFLLSVLDDMIGAGSETTTTTLRWAVVYLVNFPECQQKCIEQIEEVVGMDRLPTIKDKPSLPYIEAFLHETLRMSSIAPMAVPHKTTCDTSIGGYKLPKDSKVIFNLYALHRDEKEWPEPLKFDPTRFLDDNGQLLPPGHNRAFLPFSAGRRICLAESLAKLELFLVIAQMIAKFQFLQAPGHPLPSLVGQPGLFLGPKPHKIVIDKRVATGA